MKVYIVMHQGDGASFIDGVYEDKLLADEHVLFECSVGTHCWHEAKELVEKLKSGVSDSQTLSYENSIHGTM